MKITESRLRSIIQGVIRETYEFPTKSGMELLNKIYNDTIHIGATQTYEREGESPMEMQIRKAYENNCGPCKACVVDEKTVKEMGGGASFVVIGDDGRCSMMMMPRGYGRQGVDITVDSSGTEDVRNHISSAVNIPGAMGPMESVLRRVIRKEVKSS